MLYKLFYSYSDGDDGYEDNHNDDDDCVTSKFPPILFMSARFP